MVGMGVGGAWPATGDSRTVDEEGRALGRTDGSGKRSYLRYSAACEAAVRV